MKVYIVTMYRNGDREKHSYVLGAFSTYENAKIMGETEEVYRGDKYKWMYELAEIDAEGDQIVDACNYWVSKLRDAEDKLQDAQLKPKAVSAGKVSVDVKTSTDNNKGE